MPLSRITLVAHTHWDREWYQPFEVFRAHLVEMLDEALDELERDPRLVFTLDGQVALVDDYLELRPMAEPRIRELVRAGRLHVGPWYTQADTLLADGESLLRNLVCGLRRAEVLGGAMRVGYMPDQFGHAAQLPQLFRLLGIDGAVLWRGVGPERPPHAFRWIGPDGSEVTALWLQDGYGSGRRLPSDPEGFADAVERTLERLGDWLGEMPILLPVGDDHVRLATWLPDAAAALGARRRDVQVRIGGYHDHLPQLGKLDHVVRGELRSPAFAPVLAGVASARIREKQAAARATTLLERYAEPLWTLAKQAGASGTAAAELIRRAWTQLFHNHAHDSAAGCGIDAAHDDVKARYRWAEQLATAARDQALAQIKVDAPAGAAAHLTIFHPGPASATVTVEAMVPRGLGSELGARGADGVLRPVQLLGSADDRPLFEGEFSAAELAPYLGGLDPKTPLFGKYLSGISATEVAPGVVRLDVCLGDAPAAIESLLADQRRVQALVDRAERFKILMHAGEPVRPALVQVGPAPEAALVTAALALEAAPDSALAARAAALPEGNGVSAGSLRVTAGSDGVLVIEDRALGLSVRANDLVDDGDRGDLYHCDPIAPLVRPGAATVRVTESGPLRARLVVEQELVLPAGLSPDRSVRASETRGLRVVTTATVIAGERRIELTTELDNLVTDHRLRALTHLPFSAERLDVDQGLAVVGRPLDTAQLGHGAERAAPTGQHHRFFDVSDGRAGVALLTRGLPEHEVRRDGGATEVALTLLRAVGWLSRGDLHVIDHAAGPILPTPAAQELGPHRFEYALVLHAGDWEAGGVADEARRFAAPAEVVSPSGRHPVAANRALVAVTPAPVTLSAVYPAETGRGVIVRVVNLGHAPTTARLRPSFVAHEALAVDPLEQELPAGALPIRDGVVELSLRPWQIATVLLRA